jgi:hypothetical protein
MRDVLPLTSHVCFVGLAVLSILVSAPHVVAQQSTLSATDAIKVLVEQSGQKPGMPGYAAAVRDAYERVADVLDAGDGKEPDKTRTINIDTVARSRTRSLSPLVVQPPELEIDRDAAYQAWLQQQIETPFIELTTSDGETITTRSLGGSRVTNPSLFSEVGLSARSGGEGYCSGVLIGARTVLTAAHCVCSYKSGDQVVFGNSSQSGAALRVTIDAITNNCASTPESVRGRDIAVIRLKSAVPRTVSPLATIADPGLVVSEFGKNNTRLWVVGFGYTEQGSTNQKNVSTVPILTPDCSGLYNGVTGESRFGCVRGREIVAKDPRPVSVGPCPGDSGGGAYLMVTVTENGKTFQRPHLVGLVSRATKDSRVTCGDGAVFTSLTADNQQWAIEQARRLESTP